MSKIVEWKCDACGKTFPTYKGLRELRLGSHSGAAVAEWDLCHDCAKQVEEVIRLIKMHGSVKLVIPGGMADVGKIQTTTAGL